MHPEAAAAPMCTRCAPLCVRVRERERVPVSVSARMQVCERVYRVWVAPLCTRNSRVRVLVLRADARLTLLRARDAFTIARRGATYD